MLFGTSEYGWMDDSQVRQLNSLPCARASVLPTANLLGLCTLWEEERHHHLSPLWCCYIMHLDLTYLVS